VRVRLSLGARLGGEALRADVAQVAHRVVHQVGGDADPQVPPPPLLPVLPDEPRELPPLAQPDAVAEEEARARAARQVVLVALRRVRHGLELQPRERAAERVGVLVVRLQQLLVRHREAQRPRDRRERGERERGRLDDRVGVRLPLLPVARHVILEKFLVLLVLLLAPIAARAVLARARRRRRRPVALPRGLAVTARHLLGVRRRRRPASRLLRLLRRRIVPVPLHAVLLGDPVGRAVAQAVHVPLGALRGLVVAHPAVAELARLAARGGVRLVEQVDEAVEARVRRVAQGVEALLARHLDIVV
jgi:hypothetical protein